MTKEDVIKNYNIPADLLNKYEAIQKCKSYSDKDIENISMIMTLYDAGFDDTEVKKYISFSLSDEDTTDKRTAILTKKRKHTLDEIHLKQKQLDDIDYLRYKVAKENKKNFNNERN